LGQHVTQRLGHDADLGFEAGPSELEDLRLIGCLVRAGGDVIRTATGAAVMGHPAASVVWLVNRLLEGMARSSIVATSRHLRSIRHVGTIRRRALGYRSVTSVDGTRLRAWDNDGHGVPVLISNGLGTPHDAWPDINRRTDTYRVMTWDHRGLGGSQRPSDESRISISDHTDDLFAVMDSYGVDRAVVIGWSAGVNVAFEAAVRQPQRIAGVLAVGGVPGGTFEALLHPLPGFLRPRAGRVGSHLMRYLGPVLNRLGDGLPGSPEHGFNPRGVATLGLDVIHGQTLVKVLRRFADHDWPWYSRLARAVGDHPPMDLSAIDIPVTYLAGTWDAITSAKQMRAASEKTPHGRYVELAATHFVPLQFPSRVSAELGDLVDRCTL
jgi:3-oxoadipate enol-lactonase